jgi:hypothetical protein
MRQGTVVLDEMIMVVTGIRLEGGAFHVAGELQVSRRIPGHTVLRGASIHGSDGELVTTIPDLEVPVPRTCYPGDLLRLDLEVAMDDKLSHT